jgi:hypothetical protein
MLLLNSRRSAAAIGLDIISTHAKLMSSLLDRRCPELTFLVRWASAASSVWPQSSSGLGGLERMVRGLAKPARLNGVIAGLPT